MAEIRGDATIALQDHVLVETEVGGHSVGFRAVVVRINPDELWLGLTTPDRRLERVEPGGDVRLTAGRASGALLARSSFIRHLGESRCRIFAIAPAQAAELVQRRSQARVDVDLGLHLRRFDLATGELRGKGAAGATLNAGPGGLLLQTDMALAVGDDLDVSVSISAGDRISAGARVTRVGEQPGSVEGEPCPTRAAVKFTRITAVDQQRILRLCMLVEHRRQVAASQGTDQAADPGADRVETPGATGAMAAGLDSPVVAAAFARALAARAARSAGRATEAGPFDPELSGRPPTPSR
jgi:hypothetical protein